MLLMDMIKYNHTLHPPIASLSTLPYEWRGNTHLCKKIWWHFVTLYFYDIKSGTKIISQSISSLLLFYDPPLDPNWLIKAGLPWCRLPRRVFSLLLKNTNTNTGVNANANANANINIKTYSDTNENTKKKMMSCSRLPCFDFSLLETNTNMNTKSITNINNQFKSWYAWFWTLET